MKKLFLSLLLATGLFGADAANDLILTQRKADNSGNIQRNLAPTARGFFSFDSSKIPVGTTDFLYTSPTLTVPDAFNISSAGSIFITAGGTSKSITLTPTSPSGSVTVAGASNTTGVASIGPSGTGTVPGIIAIDGGSGAGGGARIDFRQNTTSLYRMGVRKAILGGATTDFLIYNFATSTEAMRIDSTTNNVTFSSALLATGNISSPALVLTATPSPTYAAGKLVYDTGNESLTFYNNDSAIGLQVGQEAWVRVRNDTGSTISNGSVVYVSGVSGGLPQISLANANSGTTAVVLGLATESIPTATIGFVTTTGVVHGFDTSAFSVGARVYLGTSNGALTATAPVNPNYQVTIGTVITSNASTGSVFVAASSGRIAGTQAYTDVTQTFTGVNTFSPTARSSGVAPYFTITAPTDTGITAATEAIGFSLPTATRTWATTGTVVNQRENLFAGKTYASAGASQTFTDISSVAITPPVQGANAIFTRGHSLQVVDSTSAASSITGGVVVAATLGTTATSVGIGGGNVNAGGLITGGTITSTGTFTASGTSTHTGVATFNNAATFNGGNAATAVTVTSNARTSGILPYIKYTIPTDTAQTASTESPGIVGVTGTRTWATTGTVALQREIFFPGPTYASASASQTFTDAFNMYLTPPVQGANAIFTRGHTLGIVDSTSAATSITGAVVVSAAIGTSATSVSIGGGNISQGGKVLTYNNVATAGIGVVPVYAAARSTGQTAAVPSVATYTVGAADGTFEVSANINITAAVTATITATVTYTDETNTSRTHTFSFIQNGVATPIQTITNVTGTGAYAGTPMMIRAKAATAITIATTGTFTSVTYNVGSNIRQLD